MRTLFLLFALALPLTAAAQQKFPGVGRAATPAEIAAWDIDVRADFKGLPKGSGSVKKGQEIWEAKCESCHGTFGESNEVFPPIAGGTTQEDIKRGRVANLTRIDYPQRTTMMKLSQVSTLWDYINRAMPWNAPKTLTVEEVYAVTAYVLHLGNVLPSDFVLSDSNIAEVQKRLPNRDGLRKFTPLWDVKGKGDVTNTACLANCAVDVKITSQLPDHARNAHGNLLEQTRLFGATIGADTTKPPPTEPASAVGSRHVRSAFAATVASVGGTAAPSTASAKVNPSELAKKFACNACHAPTTKLVGPSYAEVAKRYAGDSEAVAKMMEKIRRGGSGAWGAIPMPPHPSMSDADLRTLAEWSLRGGN